MDKFNLYVPNFLPFKEYFVPEKNQACPGCGLALAVRQSYKALEKGIEKAAWQPLMEKGGPFAGSADIFGVGKTEVSFLKIPKGNADLILCLDNEIGGSLNEALEKPMVSIAVAEGFSYVATACPSYPFDLIDKVSKGLAVPGPAYIHILSVCPTGWRCATDLAIKLGRLAIETGIFPLYEVDNGQYRMSMEVAKLRPVKDYTSLQGRFRHLSDDTINMIQKRVEEDYFKLVEKAKNGHSG